MNDEVIEITRKMVVIKLWFFLGVLYYLFCSVV